jgi:NAD(P)-dependent dehydrogenase (short-subunit alcohol dehydrogenase family)
MVETLSELQDENGRPRTAIVTGAARGIGLAIAERLASDGCRVVLVDMDGEAVKEAASRIPGALAFACDVTDPAQPDAILKSLADQGLQLDILVNNAGIPSQVGPIEGQTDAHWARCIDVMLTAPFRWCRAVVPLMKSQGWGRIVSTASVAGKEGNPFLIPYSVAKAGVICMTKALAREVALDGILVNAIAPGVVDTDLIKRIDAKDMKPLIDKIPLGRIGHPEEVANAVSFLVREATFTTGSTLDLSGGRCSY